MKKFRCTVCGYVYEGDAAPEKCPLCKAPASKFVEVEEAQAGGPLVFADEHVIGVAKGCDDEMIKDLNNHFMGECTEVGMYLAMSRQADREGYPEVAEAFKRYEGADVRLGTNYFSAREELDSLVDKVLFTGCIDEYYDFRFGHLEYRSPVSYTHLDVYKRQESK